MVVGVDMHVIGINDTFVNRNIMEMGGIYGYRVRSFGNIYP